MKVTKIPVVIGVLACNNPQRIGIGNEIFRNKWTNGDHPDYKIIKIG